MCSAVKHASLTGQCFSRERKGRGSGWKWEGGTEDFWAEGVKNGGNFLA